MRNRLRIIILITIGLISEISCKKSSQKWDFTDILESPGSLEVTGSDDIAEDGDLDEEDEVDLCQDVHCGAGRHCVQGQCVCIDVCEKERDSRRWVCSNNNETFVSDCHLHQARCFCQDNLPECEEKNRHIHIDYYGECRKIATCEPEDLVDFPRRMREWLFSVMKDLAERDQLSSYYKELEKEAETDYALRWSNAAVWKWCDLDSHPHDNAVSRHELFPLRAPLLSLEHCLGPFLDSCDKDSDHHVTSKEWSDCLELDYEIMISKCEHIQG